MIETTTDYNAMDDDAFRTMVREFVEANYPLELRFQIGQLPHAITCGWYAKLAERGWVAPAWPREYGGMGLNTTKRILMAEVLDAYGCSRYADNGVMMTGPLLIKFGSPAQREYFLPKILSGEHVWCQGYSEPNSGSDLASLRTEAVWNGEGWTLTGQKIWTSRANQAQWCHMLARTDNGTTKPQDGISYFVVPLDALGVTVRPIRTLSMQEDFCEVFFDNVHVSADALVGAINKGWSISKALMGGERIFLGAAGQSFNALAKLRQIAKAVECWGEPAFMERYARLAADLEDHNSLYEAGLEKVREGGELGLEGAMLKVHQTEMYKRIAAVAVEIAGPYGGLSSSNEAVHEIQVASTFLASMSGTIYGGSSEVQRNILAKQVLHFP